MREVLIYLAAAVICVPLATRLGIGAILGYLAAGALVGPWGLALVGDVAATQNLAELGVVLMLFVIGLGLDPKRLAGMRGALLRGGMLQLGASGAVLVAALLVWGVRWEAALVGGLALALSSTAIATQAMTDRRQLATPTGQAALGILVFQDIAAIPLIALVPFIGHVQRAGAQPMWERLAIAAGAIAGVIVIGRYLTTPLLRLMARTNLRELFTGFALLLVIGIAELMAAAGLSMGLGAFLAGVLLASSEFRHLLESDIEPFKGLLLGLFFISVGMTIDFGLLASSPVLVAGLLAGFLVLKIASLWAVARWLAICRESWLFAFVLSQGGEFAFVVFGTAREANVLSPQGQSLLTMVVALSMATTPLLLIAYDRWMRRSERREGEADAVSAEGPVIIAGFGRFGQIVGRLLLANGVGVVILDHDPEQVESLRRWGFRVFYGDATRLDLLEAAGARTARLLVNAIDDVEASVTLVDRVRANFPDLAIVSRARNVSHYFELRLRGVQMVERETFEAALKAGRTALEALGTDRFRAKELADAFRRHNIASVDETLPFYQDEARRMSLGKQGREELERQFARDRERFEREHGGAK